MMESLNKTEMFLCRLHDLAYVFSLGYVKISDKSLQDRQYTVAHSCNCYSCGNAIT